QATVTRTPGGRARPDRADIISVAGAQLLAERGPSRRRKVRRRVRRFGNGRGFISVNNGATFGLQLARALTPLTK
ncbi:hypothetical protein AB0F17_66065, partial [Nonomuraea sp. NPDC026600]|uniref:hypothetical protein n=1 Tax=Nonomuraea sp. NPDC026600 TaxID=3155363 RepID=UPI0033C2268C